MEKIKSKYKYVSFNKFGKWGTVINKWKALLPQGSSFVYTYVKMCNTEREAALAVDIKLIELGRKPVNILTHKE